MQKMADINPEDCVTLAQFNELRLNMEARADRIAQDVQNILTLCTVKKMMKELLLLGLLEKLEEEETVIV
ncbi:hypothetical protein E2562_036391 [Oryza meyeriana var. granulata]|uniref:Uncharacterized protein n=1 Tax=Oryza meyeriana var. granulata TaxID=110450 RepID=A0A6G1CX14_9ORYZ|nr:hypothetical protein E2562_036391 [Oryza meyeriana var. granulata]